MGLLSQLRYQALEEARARDNDSKSSVVLSEPEFRAALRKERRRTERSKRPFLLMLATPVPTSTIRNQTALLADIATVLAVSVRETDIVGWHQEDAVIGAIYTELGTVEKSAVLTAIRQKVNAALEEELHGAHAKEIHLTFLFFPEGSTNEGGSLPRLHSEIYGEQQSKTTAQALKRVIDIAGSMLALILLSPILLAISLIIKLTSDGPVLFRQTRVGRHGKEFTFLKFRSMYVNNDATVHKEYVSAFIAGKAGMKESSDGKANAYKVIDDPRVTPCGRFLRKTSLDELPQFINVLKGEMSLVGPRPPIPYEFASYDIWHLRRIVEVKPGITGLWQVCGRSKTSFDEMVRLDLQYASSWSLALDFIILLKTPGVVLSGDGAY